MARREIQQVGTDESGNEEHPAFGLVELNRVSQGPAGAVLFDSDVRHNHFMTLRIKRATRKRGLHRDWIHETGQLVEIAMSESQWAQLISSPNTSGTSCTVRWVQGEGDMPQLDFDSRLDLSHREVRRAADEALADVMEAFRKVQEKPTKANVRALEIVLGNAPKNMEFAAQSLTEHAESVVAKSKADIEAAAMAAAERAGVAPSRFIEIEGPPIEVSFIEG